MSAQNPMDPQTRAMFKNLIGCFAVLARKQGLALEVITQNLSLRPADEEELKRSAAETLALADQMKEASEAL